MKKVPDEPTETHLITTMSAGNSKNNMRAAFKYCTQDYSTKQVTGEVIQEHSCYTLYLQKERNIVRQMLSWYIPLGFFISGVTLPYKNNLMCFVTNIHYVQPKYTLIQRTMSHLYFPKTKAVYKPNCVTDVHDKN